MPPPIFGPIKKRKTKKERDSYFGTSSSSSSSHASTRPISSPLFSSLSSSLASLASKDTQASKAASSSESATPSSSTASTPQATPARQANLQRGSHLPSPDGGFGGGHYPPMGGCQFQQVGIPPPPIHNFQHVRANDSDSDNACGFGSEWQ